MAILGSERNSATAIDGPPSYDRIINEGGYTSGIWNNWFSTLIDTLQSYLSQYGMFIPKLTTAQRDTIQSPQVGQFIFNTTTDTLQIYLSSGAWENVTTAP